MAIIKTLKIITHPQGARYNATFSTQPVIHVGDLNTTTSVFTIDTAFVGTVLVAEGPGNTGYNLSGTLTKTFVNGVATFTDLGIVPDSTNTTLDVAAASLSFLTTNLNVVTSNTFQISNASKLVVTSTPVPTTTTLGRVMQIPVKVQFRDVDNNNIPLSGISIVASAQGATMSGTTTLQSGVTGFVIFTQLTFSGGSQVIVTFSSPGMTSAVLTINLIPTNIIKPRRSLVAGDPPVAGDIVPFEICINIPDRQLWVADETGTPVLIVDGDANTGGGGGAGALIDLTDVVITTPTNGQVLKYDTATSKWINDTDATGSGGGGGSGDYLPLAGGTMTGPIVFGTGGQYVSKGNFDTSRGGSNGISLVCAVGFEFNWQAGWLRTTNDGSTTPRPLYLDSGAGTTLKVWNAATSLGTTISHLGITYPDGTTQTTASAGGGGGSGTGFNTGSTAPTSPAQGDRWVSTNDAILYTYYGTAWVQFNT